MNLTIRALTDQEQGIAAPVWQVVYRADVPIEPAELEPEEGEVSVAAQLDGKAVGAYTVYSYNVTRGLGTLRCGGIGAVAVLPECRKLGVASSMMRWSLNHMRELGYHVAALYAYRDSYYRKFSYEVTGRRWQIKCPENRFPVFEQSLACHKVAAEDVTSLDAAYVPFARSLSGANLRSAANWKRRMGKKPPMIYAVGDPIEAYAWTTMDGGFWDPLSVGELAWSTLAGYESIMAVLRGLVVNRSELIWTEPSRSPFLASHLDQGMSITSHRHAQFRVVNVPAALEQLVPEDSEGAFTVRVDDPDVAENVGPWRVEFGQGKVSVQKGDRASIECDARAFVQALMGEPSLADLVAIGRIRSSSSEELACATQLMPPRPTMLTEFF